MITALWDPTFFPCVRCFLCGFGCTVQLISNDVNFSGTQDCHVCLLIRVAESEFQELCPVKRFLFWCNRSIDYSRAFSVYAVEDSRVRQRGSVMKVNDRVFIIVMITGVLLCMHIRLFSDAAQLAQLKSAFSSFETDAKGIFDKAKGMASGIGQMFGYVGSEYKYNAMMWNDTPHPVTGEVQKITGVMGVHFSGPVTTSVTVPAYGNTGQGLKQQQLYCGFSIKDSSGKTLIDRAISSLSGHKHNDHWYYYHVYTDKGVPKAEDLGIKTTSSEFLGSFYNNTASSDITLQFTKNGSSFTVMLDPHSCNLLQSTTSVTHSIRPAAGAHRSFVFKKGSSTLASIPLASQGIGTPHFNHQGKATGSSPSQYVYQVYENNGAYGVDVQGIAFGNFDQPVQSTGSGSARTYTTKAIRDINPVDCHVWFSSAQQADAAQSHSSHKKHYIDPIGQVWVFYAGADTPVAERIVPGKKYAFKIIRPKTSEGKTWFYGLYIGTDDQSKAERFIKRFQEGKIGTGSLQPSISWLSSLDAHNATSQNTLLVRNLNVVKGVIEDTGVGGSGVSGSVLFSDPFLPYGTGGTSYYYTISPFVLHTSQFFTLIGAFLGKQYQSGTGHSTVMSALKNALPSWIVEYRTDPQAVAKSIKAFVGQYGGSLNKEQLDGIVSGSVGLEHPPVQYQAGSSSLGGKPSGWPGGTAEPVSGKHSALAGRVAGADGADHHSSTLPSTTVRSLPISTG